MLLGSNDVDPYVFSVHNHTHITFLFDINKVILIDNIPLCWFNRDYTLYFKGQPGFIDHWNKNWVVLRFEGKTKQCLHSALTWHKNNVD